MAMGAVAIAFSSATGPEHSRWQAAAQRESKRYGIEDAYIRARMEGRDVEGRVNRRSLVDWLLIAVVTIIFVALAAIARVPHIDINVEWAVAIAAAMLVLLLVCAIALWRITRFS